MSFGNRNRAGSGRLDPDQLSAIARQRLRIEKLRPAQLEALRSVFERDTLAVLPTGSGKSAIYQVAALAGLRPAIVVSPLIALEHDQVRHLKEDGVADSAELHSSLPESEQRAAISAFTSGRITFLFITPEQLANPELARTLQRGEPRLFVVDEAHCVSEWGHQYRPDYLRLAQAAEELGRPRILALTATAAPPVRADIIAKLELQRAAVIARGFDRPNIFLAVHELSQDREKRSKFLDRIGDLDGPGIVYTETRQAAEELASDLRERGVIARHYHAGLGRRERDGVHEDFLNNRFRVVVATIAFGMGVDKPDIRFVLHYDLPASVDAYYQEIGRAGRDGAPAKAELFYRVGDSALPRFQSGVSTFNVEELSRVAEAMERARGEVPTVPGIAPARVKKLADRLQEGGGSVEAAIALQERYREMQRTRAEMMQGYAELRDCRRQYLVEYFGEPRDDLCGNCDNCVAGRSRVRKGDAGPAVGVQVLHSEWGEGTVIMREAGDAVVLFKDGGYHRLDVGLALERGVLKLI